MPIPPFAPIQAALADRDLLGPSTGQRAHDRRAAADVGAFADDHPLRDPTLHHRRAERAGVEVAEALVHDDGACRQVGSEADPGCIADAHARRYHVISHRRELVEAVHVQACARRPAAPEADVVDIAGGHGAEIGPCHRRQLAEHAVEVEAAGHGEAVRQQVQAQVHVGRRCWWFVDVDRHADRSHDDLANRILALPARQRGLSINAAGETPGGAAVPNRVFASDRRCPGS